MNLKARLLELIAPLRIGDPIALEIGGGRVEPAVLSGVSTEVGFWLSFELSAGEIQIEVSPLDDGRFAARSALHAVSYRVEGGRNRLDGEVAFALSRFVAAQIAPNEHRVAQIDVDRAMDETSSGGSRIREVQVDSALEPAGHGETRFYKLSPYAGCLIGCRYCYAQAPMRTVRRLERLPEVAWGSFVDVRKNTPDVLADELARLPPRPIKFCPILSDPYQAVEARYSLTRACLTTIAQASGPWPAMILTRSKLVLRDADLLATMPNAWIGASIPTIDDETRQHFEPRAASIPERLDMLTRLRTRGARTFAVVQPLLPGSIDALADALAEAVSSVSIDVLRGEGMAANDFADPRYAAARTEAWQRERAEELAMALTARGVVLWPGELPPELVTSRP